MVDALWSLAAERHGMMGADLTRIRTHLGWTRRQMAEWMHLTPGYYARLERGDVPINTVNARLAVIVFLSYQLSVVLGLIDGDAEAVVERVLSWLASA
jgi:transcriptional regulator with XRE-family HTH domain